MNTYFHKHFILQTEDMKGICLVQREFHWFPNDVWKFQYFLESSEKAAAVSIITHTGSNRDIERSFVPLAWNNGCFNCAAGRAVKIGYRTKILVNKNWLQRKNTYCWPSSYRRNIFLLAFSHVPWLYKLALSKKGRWEAKSNTNSTRKVSGYLHCRTVFSVLYEALRLAMLATRMVLRE